MNHRRYVSGVFYLIVLLAVVASGLSSACTPQGAEAPSSPRVAISPQPIATPTAKAEPTATRAVPSSTPLPRLTIDALKNAEYYSEWPADKRAKLSDGTYEEVLVPGAASKLAIELTGQPAFGDLDGDRIEDAALILATNAGGSGTFIDLVAVLNDKGKPKHVATAKLGDRVQVQSLSIESGEITVKMIAHGPEDPLCCPTQEVTYTYRLERDKLVKAKAVTGRQ